LVVIIASVSHALLRLGLTVCATKPIGGYINQDPIGLIGGINPSGYAKGQPNNIIDTLFSAGDLPTISQGVVDFSAGLGDGILATLIFGFASGQKMRDALGIGSVDKCST
jgi:uncharacterized protein RhaS with RHS repeats